MENEITPQQAWDDFWKFIRSQPEWNELGRTEKQYLDKTRRDLSRGKVGIDRIRAALDKYAPGRYEFREKITVIVHNEAKK